MADEPEAYWRLGERAGSVAYDSSGHGRHATHSGTIRGQAGAIVGDSDEAVFLNGSGFVQRPDSTGLVPELDSWTVEAWVKTPDSGADLPIVSWYPGGYTANHSSYYRLIITAQGLPSFQLRDASANTVEARGTTPIIDGAWHHVVGVLDRQRGTVYLYIDGVEVASEPIVMLGLISDTGYQVHIGIMPMYWSSYPVFRGTMDEVAIYRNALTVDRAHLHFTAGGGVSGDADNDGVRDVIDKCSATPLGAVVDAIGCIAQCPFQSTREQIDAAVQNALAAEKAILAEKDALIAQKDSTISLLNADVNLLAAEISAKDEAIRTLESTAAGLSASMTEKEAMIAAGDKSIATLNSALLEKGKIIEYQQQHIATLTTTVAVKDAQIAAMYTRTQLDQAVQEAKASAQQAMAETLTANLAGSFADGGFALPGATVTEQIDYLTHAIGALPSGQIRKLKDLIAP